ncbi:MAG: hypothetical protein ACKO96_04865 [Flammeovirgaceae bacterium]
MVDLEGVEMTCKVLQFNGVTDLSIPAVNVVNNIPSNLHSLVWFGINKDGNFIGGSSISIAETIVLLERAKKKLMNNYDD